LKNRLFGHQIGNDVNLSHHISGLFQNPDHHQVDAPLFEFEQDLFQDIEPRLVHIGNLAHSEHHYGCPVRNLVGQFVEFTGGTEEEGAFYMFYEDLFLQGFRDVLVLGPPIFPKGFNIGPFGHKVTDSLHKDQGGQDQPDAHGIYQVPNGGEHHDHQHHDHIRTHIHGPELDVLGQIGDRPKAPVVHHPDSDGDQDTGQNGCRDLGGHGSQGEQYDQQEDPRHHTREAGLASGIDV